MTSGYYCAIFPFCGGGKKQKKDDKKTKAFHDWATIGIPVIRAMKGVTLPTNNSTIHTATRRPHKPKSKRQLIVKRC